MSCLFVCKLVPVLREALYVDFKFMIYILYCWCKDAYVLVNLGLHTEMHPVHKKLTLQTFINCSRINVCEPFANVRRHLVYLCKVFLQSTVYSNELEKLHIAGAKHPSIIYI